MLRAPDRAAGLAVMVVGLHLSDLGMIVAAAAARALLYGVLAERRVRWKQNHCPTERPRIGSSVLSHLQTQMQPRALSADPDPGFPIARKNRAKVKSFVILHSGSKRGFGTFTGDVEKPG